MPIAKSDTTFRRLRKHAQQRLVFDPGVPRHKQLPAYKRYLELEGEMLKRHHRKGDSGLRVCQERAAMIDVIVENLFLAALDLFTTTHGPIPCKMALLATGGYGRRELNPHSDIDIMFLYPEKMSGSAFETFQEMLAEEVLYPLWDLGLKVGHASRNTREVLEAARKDVQTKNAILESRHICGSQPVYTEMRRRFRHYLNKENSREYILGRLEDERKRHAKFGDTVFLQEPDIKNGVGGLRDYQNILWMTHIELGHTSFAEIERAKLLRKDEGAAMVAAYDFLLRTRTELHLQNRKPTDKLLLEQQPAIAEGLHYHQSDIFERVESFMKDYYTAARTVYQTSTLLKERLALSPGDGRGARRVTFREALRAHQHLPVKQVDGFLLRDRVLSTDSRNVFKDDPVRLIRLFRLMQQFGARLDPDLKYLVSRSIPLIDHSVINDPSAARAFCALLRSPGEVHPVLDLMHQLGVLGRYLPEFGALTCLVQHEYYHRYTADEHVLRTIGQLDAVFLRETGTDAVYETELRKNDDPLLLYLILLLHDIGKAEGVKGHADAGDRLARPVLQRFRVSQEQRRQILFIIRNHLEMARFWQRFDLDDPQTTASFADFTEDPEKLRLLFTHTYCDAKGTAPTLWNDFKDSMHRTLYNRTLEHFGQGDVIARKHRENKDMLRSEIMEKPIEGVSREEIEAHFNLLPERYFINTDARTIELHLRMVHQLLDQISAAESVGALAPIVDWHDDIDLGMTVVNVVTWDRAGLFYKLAGALTLAGVNIISTKAISRSDHISLDTFFIMDPGGGVVSTSGARETFTGYLEASLVRNEELMPAIREMEEQDARSRRRKSDMLPAPLPPKVDVYHELSLKRTIIEVQAADRIGLLYRLSRLIFNRGFDISFARIATERGVAMDTFYIENVNPHESTTTSNLLELREDLDKLVREEA